MKIDFSDIYISKTKKTLSPLLTTFPHIMWQLTLQQQTRGRTELQLFSLDISVNIKYIS